MPNQNVTIKIRLILKEGAAFSRRRSGLESHEERPGVTGGAPWSRSRSGMESKEESCGDPGGAPWSSKFCNGMLPAILIFNICIKISIVADISEGHLEHF